MSLETLVQAIIELFYDGVWNDITADVLDRDGGIRITRGRRDEGSAADPGVMTLQLRGGRSKVNPAVVGRYSPQNPRSDLFGKIGRYTPIRVRVPSQRAGLLLNNIQDGDALRRPTGLESTRAFAFAPQPPASPSGDLDIRVDLTPAAWNPPFADALFAQWSATGSAWALSLHHFHSGGFLSLWWNDGSAILQNSSAVLPSLLSARKTVRVTLDVNDGAGNREVRFWLGDSIDGPFTQHGGTQGGAATAVNPAVTPIEVGSASRGRGNFLNTNPFRGTVHAAQLRSGIDGTIVVNPDFEAQEPAAATGSQGAAAGAVEPEFTDSTGELWRLLHYAQIVNPGIRAHMEMVRWPVRWETSGQDVWVPAEAGGVMRWLANRQEVAQSPLRRHATSDPDVVAYWPCEEGRNATQFAAATRGPGRQRITGEIDLASFDGFPGSLPLPVLGADGETFVGTVPFHPFGGGQFRGVFAVPAEGLTNDSTIAFLNVTRSDFSRVQLVYGTNGSLRIELRDPDGDLIDITGSFTFEVDGKQFNVAVTLLQDGADIDWGIWTSKLPSNATGRDVVDHSLATGTFSGLSFGRFSRVRVGVGGGVEGLAFGHLTVSTADSVSLPPLFTDALVGFAGERAANRFFRVGAEEEVQVRVLGEPGVVSPSQADAQNRELTEPMGVLRPGQLLNLLQDCADADHGIMHEVRDQTVLALQPRMAGYRIDPAVTLSYTGKHLSPPFFPEDDDRFLANDVTVSRPAGGAAREQLLDGPLSTQQPPAGIGRGHAIAPELSVSTDERLGDHASKLLHEGVWSEPRYPMVSVELRRLVEIKELPDLREALLQLDTGSRVDVTDLPEWLPADRARLIVQGYDEQIERERHAITFNTTPYGPTGQVGFYGDPAVAPAPDAPQRYSPVDHLTTASFVAGTDTALSVEDQTGGDNLLSQTADFPLDIMVAGVRLRVTAVGAPAGAVQVLTVDLAPVNGVEKTIPAGERVELYQPARYAL